MKVVNVHETKTKLSSMLAEIEQHDERFVICRNGKPVADLVPHVKNVRVRPDPFLSQVKVNCNLTEPMTETEWNL